MRKKFVKYKTKVKDIYHQGYRLQKPPEKDGE